MNLIFIFSPHYVGIGLASLQCINYPLPPPSPSDSQSLLDRLKRDVITDKYYGEARLPVHVCVSNTQTAKLNQKYPNMYLKSKHTKTQFIESNADHINTGFDRRYLVVFGGTKERIGHKT